MKYISLQHKNYLLGIRRRKIAVIVSQISLLVVLLGIWELAARLELIDSFITSYPTRIFQTLISTFASGEMGKHILISTFETVAGFSIGTLLGTAFAIIMWWSPFIKAVCEPYLVVLNSLPKIALGPIIIVWVGAGYSSIITMAVLISVVVTTINMLNGFCQTSTAKILLMKTMNATKFQLFTKLVFPSNIDTLLATLKINVGMAWIGTIMGEYLVSRAGLGYLIVYGGQVFRLDLVMACTIVLCALAGVMYFAVASLEKALAKRQGKGD